MPAAALNIQGRVSRRTRGRHGFMIENVDTFIVEVFEEIPAVQE
jgi:hypothetical protein